jgi:hypothetical protein
VTPETLTDEMIRELQRSIAGRVFPAAGMAHTELSDLWHDTEVALCELDLETSTIQQRHEARQRICSAINARRAKETTKP